MARRAPLQRSCTSIVGILLLTPPVRRLCARLLPIDPKSPAHAVALSLTMLIVINMLFTLAIGLAPMAGS